MTTMIPKPTNHFPKYQRIEVASLFQDFKTQKHSLFQIVRPPKSHSGTHIDTTIGISIKTSFIKLKSFL
jgi:hypothetical protein